MNISVQYRLDVYLHNHLITMESRRQLQSGELIKRHFSTVIREQGAYIYGSEPLVSVTKVMMSPDLGLAKIYLSVYNTEDKNAVLLMIREEKTRLKQQLTNRIRKHVRRIPKVDFYLDDTLDEMYKIDELLNSI